MLTYIFFWAYEFAFKFPPLLIWEKKSLNSLVREIRILKIKPKSILDFGCGAGVLAPIIRSLYPDSKIVGIDKSAHMISLAKKRYNGLAEFKVMDFFDYKGKHDLIIGLRSFQYLPLVRSIEKIKELLAPGGICIIVTPGRTPFSIIHQFIVSKFLRIDSRPYSPSDFYSLLQTVGQTFLSVHSRPKVISEFEGSYIISFAK